MRVNNTEPSTHNLLARPLVSAARPWESFSFYKPLHFSTRPLHYKPANDQRTRSLPNPTRPSEIHKRAALPQSIQYSPELTTASIAGQEPNRSLPLYRVHPPPLPLTIPIERPLQKTNKILSRKMATAVQQPGADGRQQPQIQPCRYKVGKTLGAGSYSVVKECVHIDTGRYYAAKVINKRLMAGREHMVRLLFSRRARGEHHQLTARFCLPRL